MFSREFANPPWENITGVLNVGHYEEPSLVLNRLRRDSGKDFLLTHLDLLRNIGSVA